MLSRFFLLVFVLVMGVSNLHAAPSNKARPPSAPPTYKNKKASVPSRIEDALRRMTWDEKIQMLQGNRDVMESLGVRRLGIPPIKMSDGPMGVHYEKSTAFPAAINMAATFNTDLMHQEGLILGEETLAQGRDMLLGPCVNITRAPQGGRNFEAFGEDPYVQSRFAEQWVSSVQSKGVIASTKHFSANDQEYDRMTIDVRVSERALNEIHWPAFRAAIRAGTLSIMSSYNRLNGHYASENEEQLRKTLKQKWGYKGFVISDWTSTHSTAKSANAGLDMEMPYGEYWGDGKLRAALRRGEVSGYEIDDKVRRILRAQFVSGQFDRKDSERPDISIVSNPKHRELAREIARQSLVLLKNDKNVLPLTTAHPKLAVIGPNAAIGRNQGGGSSHVQAPYSTSPLEGLKNQVATPFAIQYAVGLSMVDNFEPLPSTNLHPSRTSKENGLLAEYYDNPDLRGAPAVTKIEKELHLGWDMFNPPIGKQVEHFSVRFSGVFVAPTSGEYVLSMLADDGVRVYFNNKLVIDEWRLQAYEPHSARVTLVAGQTYDLKVEYYQETGAANIKLGMAPYVNPDLEREEAVKLAAKSDVALVFVGWNKTIEGETRDRENLNLPERQDELVHAVAAVNPRTVVVINGGGMTLMPWLKDVAAVVYAGYPGQEGGNATADLLLGASNFSGKLPISFYARAEDASSYGNYPGANGAVEYKEGIFVGYRFLDKHKVAPLFPFGFGMSYSKFEFSNLSIVKQGTGARVQFQVQNTGSVDGAETAQVYVHELSPEVERPEQELKGFQKVWLKAGETKTITMDIEADAFAYYSDVIRDWKVKPGKFEIRVGNSSRSTPLRGEIDL